MTGLEDVFGSDFKEKYEDKVKERRRERESVSDEVKYQIANQAVNEGKMSEGEEPHFTFTTDTGVTHDVLLMTLPNPDNKPIWSYKNDLDSGAVTIPLEYLGEWMSCLFNDPEDLKEMEPGEMYVIIGKMGTWEPEDGEIREQVSPVRGVMNMETINEYAKQNLEEKGITRPSSNSESEDEQEEEDSEDEEEEKPDLEGKTSFKGRSKKKKEEESSEDEGGLFGDDDEEEEEDEDEEEVARDDVKQVIEQTAQDHPEIWEVEGEGTRLNKVSSLVANKLGVDTSDSIVMEQVKEHSMSVINEHNEGEEEEDEEEDALF